MIIIHVVNSYQYGPRPVSPVDSGSRILPIEVKSGSRVRPEALRHLDGFLDDYPDRAPLGVVLFDTRGPTMLTRRMVGLPVSLFI